MIALRHRLRPAFTLTELLVVLGLMLGIAALAALFADSGVLGSQKVISAADRVSGWLLIAKNSAKRDGQPRGVRFLFTQPDPSDPFYLTATEAQYIEAPLAWIPNPDQEKNPNGPRIVFQYFTDPNNPNVVPQNFQAPNFLPNPSTSNPQPFPQSDFRRVFYVSTDPDPVKRATDLADFDDRVKVGDSLILPEFGSAYRIIAIIGKSNEPPSYTNPPPPVVTLSLPSNVSSPPQPQPVPGRLIYLATHPDLGALNSGQRSAIGSPVPPNAPGTLTTYKFGFQSQPLPLMGETILQLTGNTVIDFRRENTTLSGNVGGYKDLSTPPSPASPPFHPTTSFGLTLQGVSGLSGAQFHADVLFAPSGQLLNTSSGLIGMWIRDPEKVRHPRLGDSTPGANTQIDRDVEFDAAGEQSLVTIYTRTGFIATHPLVKPPATPSAAFDPYRNAKDGINSGF